MSSRRERPDPTIPRFFSRERRSNQNRPRVEVLRIQYTHYPCFLFFFVFFFLFAKHHRHAESDAHVAAQRQAPQVREFQGNVRPGVSRWVRARLPRRVRDGEEGQEQSEEARARTHRPRELLKSQIDETWRDRATFLSRHGRRARRWRRRCRARPLEAPPAPLPPPGAAHIRG